MSKITQSGGFLGNTIGKLGKEGHLKFAAPLAKYILLQLATKATSSVIDNFKRKMCGIGAEKRAVNARKRFTLFIWN